ncbi:MAG: hypothetical protein QOJ65_480 [Fimbriimonadaceae bacterium]|jgi:type II secretory pathway pseudopilin PulG|nr:hypothetical protein [Fimbriimonadaceae bacterium]
MKRRGFTLIATLATVAIICILMVVMMQGMGGSMPTRKDGLGTTIPGQAQLSARDQVCRSNLGQVRQALALARTASDEPPTAIEDARIGEQFYSCPIGHEPYKYDAATGEVHCTHKGHERY